MSPKLSVEMQWLRLSDSDLNDQVTGRSQGTLSSG